MFSEGLSPPQVAVRLRVSRKSATPYDEATAWSHHVEQIAA
ncbi:hypothetical protein [Parafrankia sp. Ea1.12]